MPIFTKPACWEDKKVISDLDKDGKEVFMMYKQRGGVENPFDTYKNVLN
ncbi:MAG: hypothetical protein JJE19_03700 [Methanosarcinales archaeon]|nr:hypothetical protein [Methanosarcinales archaeon]